ncbi:MAG: TetR/AcrR family transcriptional regulator [Bacteroidetes bacterium]|nr:TetR/AcrR family transcriptional regulator [Bacteroidota bacterium]
MEVSKKIQGDAFERIVDASAELFAENAFHSVGVREIANKANVNISMISYYFGGKAGILIEILNRFFDLQLGTLKASIIETDTKEQSIKRMFHNIVSMIRNHTNICLIGFSDLPNNVPEVYDLKINKTNQMMEIGNQISTKFGIDFCRQEQNHIIGPAMMSMLISHFTHKNFISQIYKVEFNDEYYDSYCNTLADLFLFGITGFLKKNE